MSNVDNTLAKRRLILKKPDYDIEVWITGVKHGSTGFVNWVVQVEGEDDPILAAGILERAAEVLRDDD